MNENPYQTPAAPVGLYPAYPGVPTLMPRAEGKYLVVPSGTVLPPVCVRTGQPVSEKDMVRKRYDWAPSWVPLLVLVSGLLLIIVYFVIRKICILTFGLHPQVRRKYRVRMLIKALLTVACFIAIPLSANTDFVAIPIILFLVSLVVLFFGNSPLSVAKYRDGLFWIKGCSPEYLAGIASLTPPGTAYPSSIPGN